MTSILEKLKHPSALSEAQAIQAKAGEFGFDFPDFDSTYAKFNEELAELQQAITEQNPSEIEKEFGDCLFALVNVGRKLGLSSEQALRLTIDKFYIRFHYIEQQAEQQGKTLHDLTLAEMDALWDEAKQRHLQK